MTDYLQNLYLCVINDDWFPWLTYTSINFVLACGRRITEMEIITLCVCTSCFFCSCMQYLTQRYTTWNVETLFCRDSCNSNCCIWKSAIPCDKGAHPANVATLHTLREENSVLLVEYLNMLITPSGYNALCTLSWNVFLHFQCLFILVQKLWNKKCKYIATWWACLYIPSQCFASQRALNEGTPMKHPFAFFYCCLLNT